MSLTDAQQAVIRAFAAAYPVPTTGDDAARDWTHRLCEQLAFSCPADGWGHKRADPTRPHSADCIAIRAPFVGWDIIDSAGTPQAALRLGGQSLDLSGQTFEPVTPTNHLADDPPPPPPPPPTDCPCEEQLNVIIAQLHQINATLVTQQAAVVQATNELRAEVAKGIRVRF
jgi:hypothetical protein